MTDEPNDDDLRAAYRAAVADRAPFATNQTHAVTPEGGR